MIVGTKHRTLLPSAIAAGVALALLTSSAAYLCAGEHVWRNVNAENVAQKWPAVEFYKATNAAGITNKTPAALATLGGVDSSRYLNAWVMDEHAAEVSGSLAALATGVTTFFLILLIPYCGAWRAQTRDFRKLKSTSRKLASKESFRIGNIPVPTTLETRHILLCGSTGTGKSQTIRALIPSARTRGIALAVVDRGGSLFRSYAKNGDYLLNFFDRRSMPLSPLVHARNPADLEFYAQTLFNPESAAGTNSQYFLEAASLIAIQVLTSLRDATNADLWQVFCDRDALLKALQGTPAQQYLSAKEWPSIFNTVFNRVRDLQYLPAHIGRNGFSARRWTELCDTKTRGSALWLVMPPTQAPALSLLATSTIGTVINAAQGLTETNKTRLLVVTDELGNLPPLPQFQSALSEGRKFGLTVVSGIQADAQLRQKYGSEGDQILKSCFTTKVFFRTEDAEAAEWCSKTLSDVEVVEKTHSTSDATKGQTSSVSERIVLKRAVPATEILHLPDRTGYLKLGPFGHCRITVPVVHASDVYKPFVPRRVGDPPTVGERAELQTQPTVAFPADGESKPVGAASLDLKALSEIAAASTDTTNTLES